MKFNPSFSRFTHERATIPTDTITLADYAEEVRSDRNRVNIEEIRNEPNEAKQKALKGKLHRITPAGAFKKRNLSEDPANLTQYSRLVFIDIDAKDNPEIFDPEPIEIEGEMVPIYVELLTLNDQLKRDPRICFKARSSRGGIHILVKTEALSAEDHRRGWASAAEHFKSEYGLIVDEQAANAVGTMNVTYDPHARFNPDSDTMPLAPIEEPRAVNTTASGTYSGDYPERTHSDKVMLTELALSVFSERPNRDNWLKLISSTVDNVGESDALRLLCKQFPEEEQGEYQKAFKSGYNKTPAAWLFDQAKKKGFDHKTAFEGIRAKAPTYPELANLTTSGKTAAERSQDAEEEPTEEASLTLFKQIQSRKFDAANPIKPIPAFLNLGDTPIIRRGNISTLTAQKSAGKTHALSSIMRTLATGERSLGFNGKLEGKIAYLDFEQSGDDFDHALRFQARAAETDKIEAYHLTGYGYKEARRVIHALLRHQEGLKLLVIDGYADCVKSVNDDEDCAAFVASLLYAAQEQQIAILGVLHLNPGSDSKSRGHLGSELDRKSETVLQITQDGEIREIWTSKARKKPISKGSGIRFEWSDAAKGFVEIAGTKKDAKQAANVEEWKRTLYDIQEETSMQAWKYGVLIEAIQKAEKCSKTTAKNRHSAWLEAGLLTHCGSTGNYTSTLGNGATFGNGILATV